MEQWSREVSQAARRLTRVPVFSGTILVVFVVALGIAMSVSSLAIGIFAQAVPYEDASRLVQVYETNESENIAFMQSSVPTFQVWLEQNSVFEQMRMAHAPLNLTLSTVEGTERVIGGLVSPSVFTTLGVESSIGRVFGADEVGFGTAAQSVLISHELWTREFGADPAVIGSLISVNGSGWNVVGVLPPRTPLLLTTAERVDVWLPLGHAPLVFGSDVSQQHTFRAFWAMGRLRPGLEERRLREEAEVMGARISEMFPDTSEGWEWKIRPLTAAVTQQLKGPTVTLVVGALLLLVVAMTNIVGLFVQRARGTTRAAAVRIAVGAMKVDLTRTAATEAVLLAVPGTLGGLVFAQIAVMSYGSWMPFPLPPFMDIGLDVRVIGGAVILASVTVLTAASLTSWWWWRSAASTGVGTRAAMKPANTWSAARLGLGLQVSLATVLTIAGLLTARSFGNLASADVGIRPERLLTARVDVPAVLRPVDELSLTSDEILERLRALPEVSEAALWSPHVPAEATWHTAVAVFSRPDLQAQEDMPLVRIHQIGQQAATLLGLGFVAGRDFTADDRSSGNRVALVSETAASEWWGTENPIGRRIRRWNHEDWSTVVGVVRDTPLAGRQGEGSDFFREVYFLYDQDPQEYLVFLMRIKDEALAITVAAEQAIRSAAPDLPVYGVRFMDEILSGQEQVGRSTAMLGTIFALTALVLVGVGLYGILSHLVAQKAIEISLRKALGATTSRIVREVTVPAFVVLLFGGGVGLAVAWSILPSIMVDALFGVAPTDVSVYAWSVVILLLASVPALIGPALRGSRQSAVTALRRGMAG